MNYVGKFDATLLSDGPGAHSPTYVQVDHLHAHAPADAILVPDAQLLFNGDFTRSGVDLILSKDDREFVLHDYFKGEKRAALASPDGAHLTGDLVNALTGEVQYSQAGGQTNDHQVIGHVSKLQGSATAIRNGVSIILNNGDNVEKGDVVQSGSDSTLGVTFIDGTVFGLSSNARMVLNEMVYDPNGSNNSSLLSLVAGTITFVAGETAKHGDMKIDTPVATMGIRGTAVLVEIDFTVPGQGATPDAKFQVLVEPDGTTGSYILFDKTTLQPIAMVNLAGQQINISNGVISQSSTPLSPDVQKLITDVFSLKFSDANTNTKTTTAQTDTLNPELVGPGIKLADGTTATPIFLVTTPGGGNGPSVPNLNGGPSLVHIAGSPLAAVLDASGHPTTKFGLTELPGKTGDATDQDTIIGNVDFVDINPGDRPTVKVDFSSFVYQNAQHQNLTLDALQQQDIAATEIKLVVVPGPGNNNNGNATWTYSLPDNAFDFLAAGETLTLTYNVRVDNNYAPLDEFTIIPITITITGTNDAPVITSSAPRIAFAGGTTVSGGNLPLLDPDPVTGTKDPTSGTLSFKDVDLTDTHTVSAALTGAVGVLNGVTVLNGIDELPPGPFDLLKAALTASIGTDSTGTGVGTINWNLTNLPVYIADFIPTGEKLTLTYTVTLTDSQGATTTQDVTVTIGGTNAPAVVWIDTTASPSGGQWNVGTNWETGTVPIATDDVIIITDQLIGLTPVYPVTIDSDIAAVANSLTMNDFGPLFTNSPKLVNQGTLTVGLGGISLKADSIIENDKLATISVAGPMEVLEQSSLQNYGQITLQGGGDFKDQSTITNFASGTIEVSGGTLNVLVDVANSGQITVDAGAMLALNGGTIDGGTVSISGTLELEGAGILKNGSLGNFGQIKVSGIGNALDAETVIANSALEIMAGGALLIDQGSSITNGKLTVDGTATLTLNDATITSGTVTNEASGTIDLTGGAALKSASLDNSGQINVSGNGNALDGETVTNDGTGAIDVSGALTLFNNTSISNAASSNAETVEIGASLTLQDTSFISGGAVINEGTLNLQATSALKSGTLTNTGAVNIFGTGNTLDGETVTNNGAAGAIDISGALALEHAANISDGLGNAETVDSTGSLTLQDTSYISGGAVINEGTLNFQATSVLKSGTLTNTGKINVSGTGNTFVGETVTNNGTAGAIDISGALTLEHAASITNGLGNAETVDSTGSLTLQDTSYISGGTVSIAGTLNLEGTSFLQKGILTDTGQVDVSGSDAFDKETVTNSGSMDVTGALTLLDNASIGNVGSGNAETVEKGASLTLQDTSSISGGKLINLGSVYIEASSGATFDGVNVDNRGGVIQVDASGPPTPTSATLILDKGTTITGGVLDVGSAGILDLENATINGSTLSGAGKITTATGNGGSTLNGVTLDSGTTVTAAVGALDLTGTITNHGEIDAISGVLNLVNAIINGGTLGGSGAIATAIGNTGSTLNGVTVNSGTTVNAAAGTLDLAGTITNNGEIDATTGVLDLVTAIVNGGTLGGTGTVHVVSASKIAGNATLDSSAVTVDAALMLDNVTVSGSTITDNAGIELHDTVKLTGGAAIQGQSGSALGAITNLGTLEVAGAATLLDDTLTNTGHIVQVDSGQTLDLEGSTINDGLLTLSGMLDSMDTSFVTGASIVNTGNIDVTSGTLTIDPAPVTNTGTMLVTDGSTLVLSGETVTNSVTDPDNQAVTNGTIEVDATGPAHISTLDLEGSTIDGGIIKISGVLDSTGNSFIDGATIDNTGTIEVTGGTLTIDAASTLSNTGTLETNGGNLIVDTAVSGNLEIKGASVLELGASAANAYSSAIVTFDPGSTGTLKLDHSETFKGTVVGLDDNKLDLGDIAFGSDPTVRYAGTASSGVLSVLENGVVVSNIQLTGDYLGTSWSVTGDGNGGTDVTEVPGAISGLNSQGNAVEDSSLIVSITDGGQTVSNASYAFEVSTDGVTWTTVQSGTSNSFTPSETYEGQQLRVAMSFTDGSGNPETSIVSAGTVQESPTENASIQLTGLTDGNSVQGTPVTASVTEADAPSRGITYTWTVGGQVVETGIDAAGATYTPTETDEGKAISVAVSFTDTHGFVEKGTTSAGTVQEIAGGDLVATLSSTTAQQGVTIHITGVTDGGVAVSTGLSYAWQESSNNGSSWVTVGTNSGFTPGESDEGKLLQLVVTYKDASGTESSTYSLGMPNDLVATLDSTTAQQGLPIHVTGVTDGSTTVSKGVSYDWQVSSDNGHDWTTVGQNSSFTPVAADAGEQLQVVVTYKDSGENESTTDSLGIVAPATEWLGGNHDWQTSDQWTSGVPTSGENAVVDASGTYTVKIDDAAAAQSLVVNDSGATVEIFADNTLTLGGNLTIDAGKLHIDSGGTLKDSAASATIAGTFTDNGTIESAGGALEIASAVNLAVGKFKIDAGDSLQLDHADALNVSFTGSGELILKDPSDFSGIISDSGGSLTAADKIDLAGFDTGASVHYFGTTSGGIVSVSETDHSPVFLFVGANSTHWSAPVSDGQGGIVIHDPPDDAAAGSVAQDPGPAPGQTIVASAPNQTLTGLAASDNFVFNFANIGHGAVANFHPATDTLQFASPIFANAQAVLNATHDDGLGNTVVTLDGHDTVTLSGVVKAQLHVVDFHVV